jgi:transcriptional regulator with XRE-family HTH domain
MAGRTSFSRLRGGLSAESRDRAASLTMAMERDMSLAELRRARAMTQDQLAADLHVGQASIAKLERRTDMYLSTLRRFVEAMGGELEIVATFPDRQLVRLRGLGDLAEGDQRRDSPGEPAAEKEKCRCPECGHVFQGNGFDGIDAHWRAKHNAIMSYEKAWPLIRAGRYSRPVSV